mgnify:CR=1 FL=1
MKEITLNLTKEQAEDIVNAILNYNDASDEWALSDIADSIEEKFED